MLFLWTEDPEYPGDAWFAGLVHADAVKRGEQDEPDPDAAS